MLIGKKWRYSVHWIEPFGLVKIPQFSVSCRSCGTISPLFKETTPALRWMAEHDECELSEMDELDFWYCRLYTMKEKRDDAKR